MSDVVLFRQLHEILCRAVCAWAGVPLQETEVARRAREFAAMIDAAGAVGPWNWTAILLRRRTERWIAGVVERVRAGKVEPVPGRALQVIAAHRDLDGGLLDPEVAAVELINVLRPTVAVARFATFAALALHEHPVWRDELRDGSDGALERFVQEVLRFYPFFPVVAVASVRRSTGGAGISIRARGSCSTSTAPTTTRASGPSRMPSVPSAFGTGTAAPSTSCRRAGATITPDTAARGEWIVIELMKRLVRLLLATDYEVPDQDLRIDMSRMPAIPKSRFVIRNIRPAAQAGG